jgi:hypothetical protein
MNDTQQKYLDHVQARDWSKCTKDSLIVTPVPIKQAKASPSPVEKLRPFLVKGVGWVEGTSYQDAEKNCKAKLDAYRAGKCGDL